MLEFVPTISAEFFIALIVELGVEGGFTSAHVTMCERDLKVSTINGMRTCKTEHDEFDYEDGVPEYALVEIMNRWVHIREAEFYWEGGSIHIQELRTEVHVRGVSKLPDRTKLPNEGRPARLYFVF